MILIIGAIISLLVFLILFWFYSSAEHAHKKKLAEQTQAASKHFTISSKDIETIAGEDVITTQLDLARAYIETDRKSLAKNILNNVLKQGNAEQREEAKRLLLNLQVVS